MRILLVHNLYRRHSGEEGSFFSLAELLQKHGQDVLTFTRRSADISPGLVGNAMAFASGIWSFAAQRDLDKAIRAFRPDLVHIQNIFPLISASAISLIASHRLPIVMRCPNYRLFCPTGLMLRDGKPCTKCVTGREIHCVLNNCEQSLGKSLGYALRNAVARPLLIKHVTRFVVLSQFQRSQFIQWGIPDQRISVIPNFLPPADVGGDAEPPEPGGYVAYVGRVSLEKGIRQLLEAARQCPEIPFRIAGHADALPDVTRHAPPNVKFVGELQQADVRQFIRDSRFIVVPSIWYEAFGLVAIEAMVQSRPVIASRIGALEDIVDDGVNECLV